MADGFLVQQIRDFCIRNYEDGYDTVVECWDQDDLAAYIDEHDIRSKGEVIAVYAPTRAYSAEIMAEAF